MSLLQKLEIDDNRIVDISPLAGLSHLQTLNLHENQINDISSLVGLTSLQILSLHENQISDITFLANLSNLQWLNLHSNQISDISPLVGLTSLQYLILAYNPLNQEACDIYIPQLANNPGMYYNGSCSVGGLTISSTVGGTVIRPGEGTFTYERSEPLFLEARADPGFVFVNWTGSLTSPQNPTNLNLEYGHYEIRANFLSIRDTIYVDDNASGDHGPGDPNVSDPGEDGTPEHPFDSIQEAIEVAKEGARVIVRPGTYPETIEFLGKAIEVNGLNSDNPNIMDFPVINGQGKGTVVRFTQREGSNSVLTGLVITGGKGRLAGGIHCSESSPRIVNCLIVGNRSTESESGGGISCSESRATFINCTMAGNNGGVRGAGLWFKNSQAEMTNSIVWGNGPVEVLAEGSNQPVITYTDVGGGWPGLGDLDSDPLFVRPGYWSDPKDATKPKPASDPTAVWVSGDYHLRSAAGRWDPAAKAWINDTVTSPCIDTGDTLSPIGAEPMPNGNRINLGVYGGTVQTSQSDMSSI